MGIRGVGEALRAKPTRVVRLLVTKDPTSGAVRRLTESAKSAGIAVVRVPPQEMDRRAAGVRHQNLAAELSPRPLPAPEDLLTDLPECPILLVLDGIQDPRNLGAILRSAEAAGVNGVFLPTRRSSGLTPAVVRSSAGAAEHIPLAMIGNVSGFLEKLKNNNFWVFGLDPTGEQSYHSADLKRPIVLVAGGEGPGLRPRVLKTCDERLRIPLPGRVDSLNVSVAVAVVLFEALRQRKA